MSKIGAVKGDAFPLSIRIACVLAVSLRLATTFIRGMTARLLHRCKFDVFVGDFLKDEHERWYFLQAKSFVCSRVT
jgi:hypothetical protein